MPTYLEPALSLDDEVVPEETRWFFRRHLQNAIYDFLIRTFRRLEDADHMTKAQLSARLKKDPAQVTRWLNGPSNLRLDTISDLFVGMAVDPSTLLVDELSTVPLSGVLVGGGTFQASATLATPLAQARDLPSLSSQQPAPREKAFLRSLPKRRVA